MYDENMVYDWYTPLHMPGTYQIGIFDGLQMEDVASQGYLMPGDIHYSKPLQFTYHSIYSQCTPSIVSVHCCDQIMHLKYNLGTVCTCDLQFVYTNLSNGPSVVL